MKVLFLQIKGKTYGGVWQVNKTVGEALIEKGYDITVLSIRENHNDYNPDYDKRMKVETLNKRDLWETFSWTEIFHELKGLHFNNFIFKMKNRLHNNKTMKEDIIRLANYINDYNPDYIITSHYQLLDMIPKNYLSRTFNEIHCSFKESWSHKATRKALIKYNNKVKYIWLCKKTMEEAEKHGLNNNYCLYNAVRFEVDKISDVVNNKKLVTIARISPQKRIDRMINIANEIFKDNKYKDWCLEIWGDGDDLDRIASLNKSAQIKLMGRTKCPDKVFLKSSINLMSSEYEGFALSILEANECGVPTVTFDFGESSEEEVLDGKTGFIAKSNQDYITKLKKLMDDPKLLKEMSINCKEFNKNFRINNIIKDWIKILK